MLRAIVAPTDFLSIDRGPRFSAEEKLDIIARSPVTIRPSVIRGKVYPDSFIARLPFTDGAIFNFGIRTIEDALLTDYVNVGDAALYGHGIGSRLLRASTRYAVEQDDRVCRLGTGWARLGLVNTVANVFGVENTGVTMSGEHYGWGGDRPLEAIFDDQPPKPNEKYLVNGVDALIDRDLAMTWEEPIYLQPRLEE